MFPNGGCDTYCNGICITINLSNYFMNGKDENGDDDGVDVSQPHERRVQLIEVLLVDVVHETLSSGPRSAAARRGVPWMK